jgi:hypothetical protein
MSEIDDTSESIHPLFQTYCSMGELGKAILFHESQPQDAFNYVAYIIAAQHGYFDFAKWAYQLNPLNVGMEEHCFAFATSCKQFPEIAHWILTLLTSNEEIQRCLYHTCITENVVMTMYILNMYPEFIVNPSNQPFLKELFLTLCMIDHVPLAKQIWSYLTILTEFDESYAFRSSSFFGSLQIVQWLYTVSEFAHLTPDDFLMVCRNGKFLVAKWWIQTHNDPHFTYVHYAFYRICNDNDIDCAKQFFANFPEMDVTALDHLVFKEAVQRNHITIAKWLATVFSTLYSVTIQDGLITHHEIYL